MRLASGLPEQLMGRTEYIETVLQPMTLFLLNIVLAFIWAAIDGTLSNCLGF